MTPRRHSARFGECCNRERAKAVGRARNKGAEQGRGVESVELRARVSDRWQSRPDNDLAADPRILQGSRTPRRFPDEPRSEGPTRRYVGHSRRGPHPALGKPQVHDADIAPATGDICPQSLRPITALSGRVILYFFSGCRHRRGSGNSIYDAIRRVPHATRFSMSCNDTVP